MLLRPKAPPPTTMASKLKIDLNSSSPGSSRPGSSLGGGFAGMSTGQTTMLKDGDQWESFKGKGETLSGRKTKGKGISHRPAEQAPEGSKIIRSNQHKVVSNNAYDKETKVPAALNLPRGQLFFGFNVVPYAPPQVPSPEPNGNPSATFGGTGRSLTERAAPQATHNKPEDRSKSYNWGSSGQTLSSSKKQVGQGSGKAAQPSSPPRNSKSKQKERSPTPDWGVDDDDVIMIDSD